MGWEDILKRNSRGMSDSAKEVVREVMNTSSEKLTVDEVREKIIQLEEKKPSTTLSRVPTYSELAHYLSKNYSFVTGRRNHPITGNRVTKKLYFKEE